ncbi:MAG: FecR domain-containing protein [Betaproteobacteria bacterium]|jgi:hypothetical protein|nr:FecR domain-containing protein [Betaproteobacteria bacterium]
MSGFKGWRALLIVPFLLLAGAAVAREATIQVEAVQSPAWVERGSQRLPLVAGQFLKNRDRVVTGRDARVLLRLSEGSAVKLGENASLRMDALGQRQGGVFTAAFDVAKGAFRFTTGVFNRFQNRRAVNVRIATVTAGIRGTDLWGSSDAERDLVCLIEGRITVTHPEAEPVLMSEPLSFYVAPKGQVPQPVAAVNPDQLGKWAQETEMQSTAATFRKNGRWQVYLGVVGSEAEALALYDQVRAAGYPVRIHPEAAGDGTYQYTLSVPQIVTQEGAEALAARLRQELGSATPRPQR